MHQQLPARPDLEHYRKAAKELVRGVRESDRRALRRAAAVLGGRAQERFALSDAQYVIAAEHGYPTWAEFRRACERTGLEALIGVERGEVVLDYDLRYTESQQVEVFLQKRLHRFALSDSGNAVRLAGKPPGWLDAAAEAVDEFSLNVSRKGVVYVGTVYPSSLEGLCARTAEASLAVYAAVRDLDE